MSNRGKFNEGVAACGDEFLQVAMLFNIGNCNIIFGGSGISISHHSVINNYIFIDGCADVGGKSIKV